MNSTRFNPESIEKYVHYEEESELAQFIKGVIIGKIIDFGFIFLGIFLLIIAMLLQSLLILLFALFSLILGTYCLYKITIGFNQITLHNINLNEVE